MSCSLPVEQRLPWREGGGTVRDFLSLLVELVDPSPWLDLVFEIEQEGGYSLWLMFARGWTASTSLLPLHVLGRAEGVGEER